MAANAKTILVVDDDKLVLAMYKFAFEDHGYRVLLADDGNAAVRTLESQQVDVVFLDILMPEKEGLETLLEIKQRFPEVAVFVMSGGGTRGKHDFLTVAKKFGATGIVKKPATPKDLIALIDALPEKHSSESNQRIA
jgi:DNA-binding response OmpR family regulator